MPDHSDPHHGPEPIRHGGCLAHGAAHARDHQRWSRRAFLSRLGLASAGVAFSMHGMPVQAFARLPMLHTLARQETDRILVLIQLNGGNDGLNMVVPVNNDIYYQRRPTIAITKAQALTLDDETGLHPAMGSLMPLWGAGHMAVINNAGYPSQTRSHFEGTVNWSTARDQSSAESTGWLGRYLTGAYPGILSEPLDFPLAVRVGGPATVFQSTAGNLSVTFGDASQFEQFVEQGGFYDAEGVPETIYGPALAFTRRVTNASFRYVESVQTAATNGSNLSGYPGGRLSDNLSVIARMVRGRLATPMYMVSHGSFDTHSGQGGAVGQHANLLGGLAQAVSAFYEDLAQDGLDRRVVVMTFSEFGRTLNENGSGGTDHGSGAPMLVFGSGLRGGLYGRLSNLTDLHGGDPLFTTDYRAAYATLLEDWFGMTPADVDASLGGRFDRMGFVADAVGTGAARDAVPAGFALAQNYPNPFNPTTRIPYTLPAPASVTLAVYDVQGRAVQTLASGVQAAGTHTATLDARRLPSGVYFYRLTTPQGTLTRQMTLIR